MSAGLVGQVIHNGMDGFMLARGRAKDVLQDRCSCGRRITIFLWWSMLLLSGDDGVS
jgi:hypothetical protein